MSQVLPIRAAVVLDRPADRIAHALHRFDVWSRTAHFFGYDLAGNRQDLRPDAYPVSILRHGDLLRAHAGSKAVQLQVQLPISGPTRLATPTLHIRAIAQQPRWLRGATIAFHLAETGAGSLVTAEFLARGPAARLAGFARGRILRFLRQLLGVLTLSVHETVIVVAAAIHADGKVLAARRSYPAKESGKWELPGGKAADGEADQDALKREIAEELGIEIMVGDLLGHPIPLGPEMVMHTYLAQIESGSLALTEHSEIRWLGANDLADVDWLPADIELLPDLRAFLSSL